MYQNVEHLLIRSSNLPSLQVLIQNNVLSESMAKKIADSGLNYSHIKLAYDRNGDDGIKDLFTEKFVGKRRVTADRKIISRVCQYFSGV